jgi:hypothetical protein
LFKGRNGFNESTPPSNKISDASRLNEEARKRRLAVWTLKHKGSYFPTLEEMKKFNAEPETTATIKNRIDELKKQHTQDMESLYAYYAQIYHQEQEDLYLSKDDTISSQSTDPSVTSFNVALDELYKNSRLPINYQLEWDDAISRIRYSYLQTLLPLQKKLTTLSAQFPESLDAYRAMDNNQDMQLRVAKFLLAPSSLREAMLSDFGWAWRQVKFLTDLFSRDAEFRLEVQKFVRDNEVHDPRKRGSTGKSL